MMYHDPFDSLAEEHDRYGATDHYDGEGRSYWALAVLATIAGILVIVMAAA